MFLDQAPTHPLLGSSGWYPCLPHSSPFSTLRSVHIFLHRAHVPAPVGHLAPSPPAFRRRTGSAALLPARARAWALGLQGWEQWVGLRVAQVNGASLPCMREALRFNSILALHLRTHPGAGLPVPALWPPCCAACAAALTPAHAPSPSAREAPAARLLLELEEARSTAGGPAGATSKLRGPAGHTPATEGWRDPRLLRRPQHVAPSAKANLAPAAERRRPPAHSAQGPGSAACAVSAPARRSCCTAALTAPRSSRRPLAATSLRPSLSSPPPQPEPRSVPETEPEPESEATPRPALLLPGPSLQVRCPSVWPGALRSPGLPGSQQAQGLSFDHVHVLFVALLQRSPGS